MRTRVLALVGADVEQQVDPLAREQPCAQQVLLRGRGLGVVGVQLVAERAEAAAARIAAGLIRRSHRAEPMKPPPTIAARVRVLVVDIHYPAFVERATTRAPRASAERSYEEQLASLTGTMVRHRRTSTRTT